MIVLLFIEEWALMGPGVPRMPPIGCPLSTAGQPEDSAGLREGQAQFQHWLQQQRDGAQRFGSIWDESCCIQPNDCVIRHHFNPLNLHYGLSMFLNYWEGDLGEWLNHMILTHMKERLVVASSTLPNIFISHLKLCLQAAKSDESHLRRNVFSVGIQDLVHRAWSSCHL